MDRAGMEGDGNKVGQTAAHKKKKKKKKVREHRARLDAFHPIKTTKI